MTTRWLVDTTVMIDHLRGSAPAHSLLVEGFQNGVELWSAVVVRTEVLAGMRSAEKRATHQLLGLFRWLDLTVELADRAGELARVYLRSHRAIDTVDYLIAASALQLGAELKTTNVRHFPMLEGLKPAYRL
jgi:predicted nucleic acid-binding protein